MQAYVARLIDSDVVGTIGFYAELQGKNIDRVMLHFIGIYSFFCELVGNKLTGYFPSLAIQFDIALLCCISMFYYCIRVVSNKLHIYVNI